MLYEYIRYRIKRLTAVVSSNTDLVKLCVTAHYPLHRSSIAKEYKEIQYCSNATSHSQVPNSRVEHCYMQVNCNDSRVILCILMCSILCVYLVFELSTCKLHTWSAYTCEYPRLTRECPTHAVTTHAIFIQRYNKQTKVTKYYSPVCIQLIHRHHLSFWKQKSENLHISCDAKSLLPQTLIESSHL